MESKINLNKQIGRDVFEDYKFSQEYGRSLQHSHGFTAVKDKFKQNEFGGFDFHEIKQIEYSTLLFGAVSDTPLHSIKSEGDIKYLIKELKLKLSICTYSDEYGKLIEQKVNELESLIGTPEHKAEPHNALTKSFININLY